MNNPISVLHEKVRGELFARKGQLRRISKDTGLSYDTIQRIRDKECDPGISKVEVLYEHLFGDGEVLP